MCTDVRFLCDTYILNGHSLYIIIIRIQLGGATVHYIPSLIRIQGVPLFTTYPRLYVYRGCHCSLHTLAYTYTGGATVHYIPSLIRIQGVPLFTTYPRLYVYRGCHCSLHTLAYTYTGGATVHYIPSLIRVQGVPLFTTYPHWR